MIVLILPLVALGALLFVGAHQAYKYALQAPTFALRNIEVENPGKYSEAEILKTAGVKAEQNILTLNLQEIQARLEDMAAIHSASVAKVLPDTLRIHLTPEIPVALVNLGTLFFMNREGKVYDRVHAGDALLLPLIHVEGGEVKEKVTRRLARALEIIDWSKSSQVVAGEVIGDITVRGESYDGMAPLEMTLALPPGTARKDGQKRYLTVTFAEDNLPKQMQRLEVVLKELLERRKIPTKIRMELDKKVVVKIAQ